MRQPSFGPPTLFRLLSAVLAAQFVLPAQVLPAQQQVEKQAIEDVPMAPAAPMETIAAPVAAPATRLSKDDQALLILNRFTYGPRPGDLERLKAEGLSAWFSRQLNPQRIDDGLLAGRLAEYPAMQLPLGKLFEQYPNNGTIKAAAQGRVSIPHGAGEKAIYESQMERYRNKKGRKDAARSEAEASDPEALPASPQAVLAMDANARFNLMTSLNHSQMRLLMQQVGADGRPHLTDGFTPRQVEVIAALGSPQAIVISELIGTKLLRSIYSERQLNEVMVDFWLNHFNVYIKKNQQEPYFITSFERDTIRPRALGNFENLLIATATSPAMLTYLDNYQSVGPHSESVLTPGRGAAGVPASVKKASGLNENYARELMELHTLGVNGGYTQHDVTEVAKVFTGWTVGQGRNLGNDRGQASTSEFDPARHEPGDKTVLGTRIKSGGSNEGMQVLHMLANSPQTARFVSTKLAVRFVSDTPPPAMVDRMTSAFLATHGDIRRVLLAMINSPEFFTSATLRAKVKTPQDYVISAVRASGADVLSPGALGEAISELGMPIYGHQTPDGYSMRADPWNSTASLVARMNFALALSSNRVPGVVTDWPGLLALPAGSQLAALPAGDKDRLLEDRILHAPVSDRTRKVILSQIAVDPTQQRASLNQISSQKGGKRDALAALHTRTEKPAPGPAGDAGPKMLDTQTALAAGLIFGSPEFQRR